MFARNLARTTRPAVRNAALAQRRTFAAETVAEYEGAEASVRKFLPKDEDVVAGMIGLYAGLYLLSKVVFGGGTFGYVDFFFVAGSFGHVESGVSGIFVCGQGGWELRGAGSTRF